MAKAFRPACMARRSHAKPWFFQSSRAPRATRANSRYLLQKHAVSRACRPGSCANTEKKGISALLETKKCLLQRSGVLFFAPIMSNVR
jgi:hypothetical protein